MKKIMLIALFVVLVAIGVVINRNERQATKGEQTKSAETSLLKKTNETYLVTGSGIDARFE